MATEPPFDDSGSLSKTARRRKRKPKTIPFHKLWRGQCFKHDGAIWVLCNLYNAGEQLYANAICLIPKRANDDAAAPDVGDSIKIPVDTIVQEVNVKFSYRY